MHFFMAFPPTELWAHGRQSHVWFTFSMVLSSLRAPIPTQSSPSLNTIISKLNKGRCTPKATSNVFLTFSYLSTHKTCHCFPEVDWAALTGYPCSAQQLLVSRSKAYLCNYPLSRRDSIDATPGWNICLRVLVVYFAGKFSWNLEIPHLGSKHNHHTGDFYLSPFLRSFKSQVKCC